jgi:hypothetical protein
MVSFRKKYHDIKNFHEPMRYIHATIAGILFTTKTNLPVLAVCAYIPSALIFSQLNSTYAV